MPQARSTLLLVTVLLGLLGSAFAQEAPLDTVAELRDLAAAQSALKAGNLELAAEKLGIPAVAEAEVDQWKKAVETRQTAVQNLIDILDRRKGLPSETMLKVDAKSTQIAREALDADIRDNPNRDVQRDIRKEELRRLLETAEATLRNLKGEKEAADKRLADRQAELERVRTDLASFDARRDELRSEVNSEPPQASDYLGVFRRGTAKIQLDYRTEWLEHARELIGQSEPLLTTRDAQARLASRRLDWETAFVKRARSRFEIISGELAADLKEQARAREAAAAAPDIPKEKAEALRSEADLLTIQAGVAADEEAEQRYRTLKDRAVAENTDFTESFAWLKERFEEERSPSTETSKLLLTTLTRVRKGLTHLDKNLIPDLAEDLGKYLNDRVAVKERLRSLDDSLDETLRRELGRRRDSLARLIPMLRELDIVYQERSLILHDLLPFVVNRIYWVRSHDSLGLETFGAVKDEVLDLADRYAGEKTRAELTEAGRRGSWPFALAAAGFLALIGLGAFLAKKLASSQRRWRYRGGPVLVVVQRVLATTLLSALAPACLVLAAQILGILGLPEIYVVPGKKLLLGAAVFLFLRRLLWAIFREEGIAVADLKTPPEVAAQLLKASRWTTRGLAVLSFPWWVLVSEPLALVTIPRILYTVGLAYYAVILISLIRSKAPLVTSITGGDGFWYRAWTFLGPLLSLGFFVIVAMDVLGYRYGARLLTTNVLQTFAAGFVIVGLYNVLTSVVKQTVFRSAIRRPMEDGGEQSAAAALKMTRFVGTVTVAVTVYLLAHFWGVDETVRSFLDAVRIYTVDQDAGEYVTLFSVVIALLWIVGAHFTVRHLPVLYDVLIFSRLKKVEVGTRFVFEAVTRYIILFFAYTSAILTLHISFSSLGYIFAALSVGIGFGLQEIVSNFISGLILLLERPVRVGDIITVGAISGSVERISIRATQVLNWDREVIIIPNRKFITEEVVNWTHNDQVVRSSIDVGVAYGTDVEKVGKILMDILKAHPKVLRQPEPRVLFLTFGDSSLNFVVRPFTLITDKVTTRHELNTEIHRRFAEEGIQIPFPQRDLHLKSIEDEDLRAALRGGVPAGLPPGTKWRDKPADAGHPPED